MTKQEIDKLHKSIAADFKIVTRKTELWPIDYCHQILHDIKKLMLFHYVEKISLILNQNNAPQKAKKYVLGNTTRTQDHRPGGIDWEEGDGEELSVVLNYTTAYLALSPEAKNAFQAEYLKIPWGTAYVDLNFPHLSSGLSKMYTHENSGVDRIDFN